MTWRPEVPADFAGESAKIRWRALPYVKGVGIDVGCGPFKAFPHSIGIDGQAYAASGNAGPNLVMDGTDLEVFADGKFDYVFSSHFLEHVHHPEAVLREWWRVLRAGGHLVLYLPHKDLYPNIGQPGANPDHKSDFVPGDIVAMMKRVGGWTLVENEVRGQDYEYSFFQVYRKHKHAGSHIDEAARPRPAKTAAIVRPGNFGDAIWASSIAAGLKEDGYHVTAYVEPFGEAVLRHDPNIDRVICVERAVLPEHLFGQFWEAERPRYDRWVNLTQTVEVNLLPVPNQLSYFWPDEVRREQFNRNYVEVMHRVAQVPYKLRQRFYPTEPERAWAEKQRRRYDGRVVVLVNGGSTAPKWWPYAPAFAQLLSEVGIHTVVVGDLKGLEYPQDPRVHVLGTGAWSIRESLAFALVAEAVVGQETGVLNAVAIEPVPKVVMLSHSTRENLTRDWINARSLAGAVPCYPCHRIHFTHEHCPQDGPTKAAQCQAAIGIEPVMDALEELGVITAADKARFAAPVAAAA